MSRPSPSSRRLCPLRSLRRSSSRRREGSASALKTGSIGLVILICTPSAAYRNWAANWLHVSGRRTGASPGRAFMSGDSLQLTHIPPVRVGMLVRRPAEVVFQALVDPAVTTRFWFTKSTGALVPGVEVQWDWEMYGVSTTVVVKAVE